MNLRDLQYFLAVADTLHFGRAAKQCHVSQPTLSMQLKKLEDTLGVHLFERSNKQVMLTAIGVAMVTRARRMLDEAAEIKAMAAAARDPESGVLRLGIFPTLAPYFLPRLVPRLVARFPKLALQLVEEKTPALMEQLAHGALDAAILAMPVAGFESRELFSEPFLLATARSHPLAKRKNVTLDDLAHARMLLLEDGHCLRDQALEVCHLAGAAESGSFRATSLETLRHMVAASDAVTLMPRLATSDNDPHLIYIPLRDASAQRRIGLFWRRSSARSALFEAVTDSISDAYRKPAQSAT
jgi:LysR family hydrogen peroxide-inducible transcriptional activator